MLSAPKSVRLHIGLFGRRNVGKSSILNALTGQDIAIVSAIPGTTTDVVKKAMELKPIGPVIFLDTAGLDDTGELGEKRVARTLKAMESTDIAVVITESEVGEFEREILRELKKNSIPTILVFNKIDVKPPSKEVLKEASKLADTIVKTSMITREGINDLRNAIVKHTPDEIINPPGIITDLIGTGDVVVLVVPIDLEAPKGRLILPQVQVLREVLDCDARAVVVKESELADTLEILKVKPKLVVTDSQAILKVVADVPPDIPLTGFSVLYARWKGDLETFIKGTLAIRDLHPGDRVLIAEACTHHPIGDDIGRVKLPRWLNQYVGGELEFTNYQGHDFPADLSTYKLVIMCGSCMINRREVLTRIIKAKESGVPIANYGLAIAFSLGVLERVLSPFPLILNNMKM